MITRITSTQMLTDSTRTLQAAMSRLSTLQQQASSGKRIGVPSDDPAGTGTSLLVHAQQSANAQYGRNASDGIGWLSTIDNSLTQSTSLLQRARTLLVEASNGTMNDQSRADIATEIDGIRSDLLAQANTQYNGRSVFAGTSDTAAFDATSYAWSGTAGSGVQRRVGDNSTVQVDADGSAAFGSGASSIFATLATVSSDLRSGTDVQPQIATIDAGIQNVLTVQAVSGGRYAQMQRAQGSISSQSLALESQRSSVEDVDTVQALVQLQSQNVAYQSALQVTAKALPNSLLDFLAVK